MRVERGGHKGRESSARHKECGVDGSLAFIKFEYDLAFPPTRKGKVGEINSEVINN